jgi:hypothetical protein
MRASPCDAPLPASALPWGDKAHPAISSLADARAQRTSPAGATSPVDAASRVPSAQLTGSPTSRPGAQRAARVDVPYARDSGRSAPDDTAMLPVPSLIIPSGIDTLDRGACGLSDAASLDRAHEPSPSLAPMTLPRQPRARRATGHASVWFVQVRSTCQAYTSGCWMTCLAQAAHVAAARTPQATMRASA